MSIINRAYFRGEIRLANIISTSPNEEAGNGLLLDDFIQKYEREVLIKCLGYPLYKLFKSQFDIDAVTGQWTIKDDADAKWDELLNGVEYQINGRDAVWKGLIHSFSDIADEEPNQSFIAPYVYSKFVVSEEYSHSGVGFQREKSKNSDVVPAYVKAINGWNMFVSMTEFTNQRTLEVTLYDFLQDMNTLDAETYPNWIAERFGFKNRYGLS